jgi:hypothetical protein
LASIWRYEGANDGHEGIIKGAAKEHFYNIAGEPDEEVCRSVLGLLERELIFFDPA